MGKIIAVGIGPGKQEAMTMEAYETLKSVDVIVGYTGYIRLLGEDFNEKEKIATGMKGEIERCKICIELAKEGKNVAMICSGDAGVYGMASLLMEMSDSLTDVFVVPGVTAAISGAAILGAPINHDFCTISLSDLLTPMDVINRRLKAAAEGDFVIALYNPSSHKRADYLKNACDLLMSIISEKTACGYVRNIGREETYVWTGTLKELKDETVDMFTTCFVGNSQTFIKDGKLVTPRGYQIS